VTPYFSIITPSLQRQSLLRTCESVNTQTFKKWQHVVALDVAILDEELFRRIDHPQRFVYQCDYPHRNYGNTCRHKAWEFATGEYVLGLDDDNWLDGNRVLEDIHSALTGPLFDPPDWAIFPIMRHGQRFFHDPPGLCMTDTANVVARREIARWPNVPDYTADGHLVEGLKKYPYMAFPMFRPIVVMPKSSEGK
jgi:hypothetical protein